MTNRIYEQKVELPEPHSNEDYSLKLDIRAKASQLESQAQAADPEVVSMADFMTVAQGAADAERRSLEVITRMQIEAAEMRQAIAKRDAALKACVDWMIGNATHQAGCGLYGFLGKCSCGLDSAITQAKGAQG